MKKNYFILSLMLLVAPFCANAQVINGDFENVKPNFLPSNWGMTFLQQFGFDENGNPIGDEIQFPWCIPSMVYASTDAKNGQYAMEVANAYNIAQDQVIPGMASIFTDPQQDSPGWNPGVPVDPSSSVILLGFDYKFLPVGNDIAQANLSVIDVDGNELGTASVDISGVHSEYEYVYTPISVDHAGTPAFMYISFTMAKPGSTPTFGTRLIVDNVIVNWSNLITMEHSVNGAQVYPTLADTEINVIPTGFSNTISYKIINAEGRVIQQNTVSQNPDYVYTMDVSGLSSGVYFLNMQDGTKNSTKKFLKK